MWDETGHILEDLFENTWGGKAEIDVPHVMDVTVSVSVLPMSTGSLSTSFVHCVSQIALLVMGAAAFGRRISWNEDTIAPPGHTMTFKVISHVPSAIAASKPQHEH